MVDEKIINLETCSTFNQHVKCTSRSKISISLEIFNVAFKIPTKK